MKAERIRRPAWEPRARRALRQIGPIRLCATLLFLLLAALFARYAWSLPLAIDAERALYDWRATETAPRVEQDQRIVMIVYNDETLEQVEKRSPLDRKMLADALKAIDAMQPKAIGIDILIDQPQQEDPLLIGAFQQMKTPTYLAFASNATTGDYMQLWQEEFLKNFLGQIAASAVRPTSIMLATDTDNVVRSWPEQPKSLPPLLANALTPVHPEFRDYQRAITWRLPKDPDRPVFAKLPIQLFATAMAPALRDQITGRYVLIGGDIQDLDDYETPLTKKTGQFTKGLEVHANLLAQLLDGNMPAMIPGWALWICAIGVAAAGALTSLSEARGWKLALMVLGQLALFALLPFYLQSSNIDTLGLPAFGWGLGWALAFAAVGNAARAVGSEQRRFAQSALGKYLPVDIAAQIMRDPERLALRGEKRQIYALFTDLEGFTKLSHAITPEQLSDLLNTYLDLMSDVVLRHGGTIDKFVGDAVVAFWGAPIARPDDADRAARAAYDMYQAGQDFAKNADPALPKIGKTRVGLHRGEAVVGNFGGEGRMQYTALGDGMNTAARLESANKSLDTTALVSSEAKEQSTLDTFRPMGRIVVSGRAKPIEVWEPAPNISTELRNRLTDLWKRFDSGDRDALVDLKDISVANMDDAALANLVYRLEVAGPGGHFVLASK